MLAIGYSFAVSLASSYLWAAMAVIAMVDRRLFLIPDIIVLPAIPLGLLASGSMVRSGAAEIVALDHLAGAVAGPAALYLIGLAYRLARRREGLGLGDVKLVGVAGAWLGIARLPLVVLVACTFALITVLGRRLMARKSATVDLATAVPFGMFLAPATWLVWMAALVLDQQQFASPL